MIATTNRIFIAGHRGMVGSAILRLLEQKGFNNLVFASSAVLDLRNIEAVDTFFQEHLPEIVILSAAKVGGIQANIDNPATFLLDNLKIQNNVIDASLRYGVKQFVFLGSSCIYPRESSQPMKEEYLLSGKLEPTNEGYALAKIAGLKLLEGCYKQFGFKSISLMPCNLYGPNDSFDLRHSHVLSALVRRFCDAVDAGSHSIQLWGSGKARREFMHVDDLAEAVLYMLQHYDDSRFINIGTGEDVTIRELAEKIAAFTGFSGTIEWDLTRPDGMERKCLDVSRMKALGYTPRISLDQGVKQMIEIYRKTKETV